MKVMGKEISDKLEASPLYELSRIVYTISCCKVQAVKMGPGFYQELCNAHKSLKSGRIMGKDIIIVDGLESYEIIFK